MRNGPLTMHQLIDALQVHQERVQILLSWVSQLWGHDNNHVERHDAVDILDRVAPGNVSPATTTPPSCPRH